MNSTPDLHAFHFVRQREQECLCDILARDWMHLQVELNDEAGENTHEAGKNTECGAEIWTDWDPESNQSDKPDPEPADPPAGNPQA